jgi:hypothetical protein
MFSENVRQLPLGEAVARTFSPEARCNLCAAVSEGKKQQQSETALNPKFEDRSLFICEPAPQYLFEADDVAGWLDNRTRLAESRANALRCHRRAFRKTRPSSRCSGTSHAEGRFRFPLSEISGP